MNQFYVYQLALPDLIKIKLVLSYDEAFFPIRAKIDLTQFSTAEFHAALKNLLTLKQPKSLTLVK